VDKQQRKNHVVGTGKEKKKNLNQGQKQLCADDKKGCLAPPGCKKKRKLFRCLGGKENKKDVKKKTLKTQKTNCGNFEHLLEKKMKMFKGGAGTNQFHRKHLKRKIIREKRRKGLSTLGQTETAKKR